MELGLKDKTALIVGASQGIGYGIAQTFAAEGCQVILASRNEDRLRSAQNSILSSTPDGKVDFVCLEMGNSESIERALSQLKEKHSIDILINNSGGPAPGKASELPLEAWDNGYQMLLRSVVQLSLGVLPEMKKNKWGRILTITSSASRELIPGLAVSATFRAGLRAWVKSIAKDLGREGILINNLLPGPINTDRLKELETKSPDWYRSMQQETAVGRLGEVAEIGKAAAFLCSNANTFTTGTEMLVDGGITRAI